MYSVSTSLVRYAVVESNAAGGSVSPPPTWSPSHVQAWLLEQAEDINPGKGISPGADLFEQGFDRYEWAHSHIIIVADYIIEQPKCHCPTNSTLERPTIS